MSRPLPQPQCRELPSSRKYPDHQHFEDLSRLGDEITEMSAHLTAGTCQLLEMIQIFDQEGGWHGTGINSSAIAPGIALPPASLQSCAHWLNWRCGMNIGVARERVRVARALPELPKILTAFRQGKVSLASRRILRAQWPDPNGPDFLVCRISDRPRKTCSGTSEVMTLALDSDPII